MARHGLARQGKARQGNSYSFGLALPSMARLGMVLKLYSRLGGAWFGGARLGMVSQIIFAVCSGLVGRGAARRGQARQGKQLGVAQRCWARQLHNPHNTLRHKLKMQ